MKSKISHIEDYEGKIVTWIPFEELDDDDEKILYAYRDKLKENEKWGNNYSSHYNLKIFH